MWKIPHFSFFQLCASFRNFQLVEGYLLDFIADFSMRKIVCELKLVLPSKVFIEKKIKKLAFEIPVGERMVSESQA